MDTEGNVAEFLTPLVIGVTGHRDLVSGEIDEVGARVAELIDDLRKQFPHTPLRLMTALAEGADRLAAHVALEAGVEVTAILPMPAAEYRDDFHSSESIAEFDALCSMADVIELPASRTLGGELKPARDFAYANAGIFISAHCHILLAIWDGVDSDNRGGTSQIIYFQHYDRLPGVAESVPRTSLFLTDDESDLVYHIQCSRRRDSKQPIDNSAVNASWFTTDPDAPRMTTMPPRYKRVFARADEYNRDIQNYIAGGGKLSTIEADPPPSTTLEIARPIQRYFDIADALADQFQNRVGVTLATIYALAILTGLTFILYSELDDLDRLIFPFLAFLISAIIISYAARRREWHRKYLDYRVLAEGLRVQYYRAIVGLTTQGHTKFAYDNFLRQRDMELGWIRNVMRVAGIMSDALPPPTDPAGLEFAIRKWIGTPERPGQLDYYEKKTADRQFVNRLSDTVIQICLWGGIAVAVILALSASNVGEDVRDSLNIMMGVLPLIAGVVEVYSQRKADRELCKQYQFMAHVFANARRRIDEAETEAERREVLQGLGDAALSEHAEWILVRRERQPEPAGL